MNFLKFYSILFLIVLIVNQAFSVNELEAVGDYYFSKNRVTNPEAKKLCSEIGMQLVELRTKEKDNMFMAELKRLSRSNLPIWLGLTKKEGTIFKWDSDGEDTTYYHWAKNEPYLAAKGVVYPCVHAYEMDESKGPGWNDVQCQTPYYAACEKKIIIPVETTTYRIIETVTDAVIDIVTDDEKKQVNFEKIQADDCSKIIEHLEKQIQNMNDGSKQKGCISPTIEIIASVTISVTITLSLSISVSLYLFKRKAKQSQMSRRKSVEYSDSE